MNKSDITATQFLNLTDILNLIDEDLNVLQVLLTEFVSSSKSEIESLVIAIENKSIVEIAEKAHKLKSTFKNFGIKSASNLSNIEAMAIRNDDINLIKLEIDTILVDFEGALNEAKSIVS